MYNLAFMYIDRFGGTWRGIKENVDDAIYWMTKVAESGTDEMNVNAMFILGHLYEDKFKTINYDERGNIRPFDDVFAEGGFKCKEMTKKWFQKADNLGHPKAGAALYQHEHEADLCFITTAVCDSFGKADDCYELTAFRNFRDKWLVNQADGKNLIAEYYNIAPKIVEKINSLSNSGSQIHLQKFFGDCY